MEDDTKYFDPSQTVIIELELHKDMPFLLGNIAAKAGKSLGRYLRDLLVEHIQEKLDITIPPDRPVM